jgi:hypothetical protein
MIDAIGGLGFVKKPPHGIRGRRQLRVQDLDRDTALDGLMYGLVHSAHSARA